MLFPATVLQSPLFAVLAAFVAINTVMYGALALGKLLPKLYLSDWVHARDQRSETRSIYPDPPSGADVLRAEQARRDVGLPRPSRSETAVQVMATAQQVDGRRVRHIDRSGRRKQKVTWRHPPDRPATPAGRHRRDSSVQPPSRHRADARSRPGDRQDRPPAPASRLALGKVGSGV
jgi:hypothetical protein